MSEATITDLHAEMQAVIANLESREWTQGREVDGDAVCAHGAAKTCAALRPGDEQIIRAVMRSRGLTEDWNDTDGRTKGEVLARMRQIEVTDTELWATFGPNWRTVIAVIRRAAALTLDEIQQLNTAWSTASGAAWAAARVAAWDAGVDAAWDAACRAVRDTRDAAWGAASDAAVAAVVADLVGQYGLTQNHIDTLMQPWIDVLGQDWAEGMV